MRRTKFANKKSKEKKEKAVLEMVTQCDNCGKPLGRTCVRTVNSSICAEGVGIVIKRFFGGKIKFFCCMGCKNNDR